MAKFFCPDCGYEGDEQICPYCYKPAESLDVDLEAKELGEKYSQKELAETDSVDDEDLEIDLDEDSDGSQNSKKPNPGDDEDN